MSKDPRGPILLFQLQLLNVLIIVQKCEMCGLSQRRHDHSHYTSC